MVYMLTNHLAPTTHRLQLEAMEARKKNGGSRGIGFTSNCTQAIHMDGYIVHAVVHVHIFMLDVKDPKSSKFIVI